MPRIKTQSNSHPRWPELADAILAARVKAGYKNRSSFAREVVVDVSTLQVIEGTKRGKVSEQMLDRVTVAIGWEPGAWRRILEDGAQPSIDPIRDASEVALLNELLRRAHDRQRASAVG